MDFRDVKLYGLGVFGVVAVIALLATLCSGPSVPSFSDKASAFCRTLDSKTAYFNEAKRIVICD